MFSFQVVAHTADTKLVITASSNKELFVGAMQGMFSIMNPLYDAKNKESVAHSFSVESSDLESLLVDWLSDILSVADIHNESYNEVEFTTFTETTAKGTVHGRKIIRYQNIEIKAVTYHELEIIQTNKEWRATIVFDI